MASIKFSSNTSKVIVTLISQIWGAVIGIILLPIYVRIIGTESYGLVAFFTTLTTSLAILDLGLSTSISRQLAMMKGAGVGLPERRSLLYSVELIYWIVAFVLGGLIVLLSHPIAAYWVNSKELPVHVIQNAIMLMGLAFAFQWPTSVYTGALNGLQKQEKSAMIAIVYVTIRALVVILALKYISGTIQCFFIAHASMVALQTIVFRIVAWRQVALPGDRLRFSKSQIRAIKHFAAGMTGISLVTFMLSQIDKIVVSKLVLLEFVGYYNLAFTLSNLMTQIVAPMQVIFFPKFSSLEAAGQQESLTRAFHHAARWVSIIVIPTGLILLLFSHEILFLWTRNLEIADQTAPILRFVAMGTVCNCLMWVPYYYMLAKGITRFSIYQNIIATIILTPLLFWWASEYGALGASWVWFTVNLGYVIVSLPLFHILYFKGHLKQWYLNNLFLPLLIAAPLIILAKLIITSWNMPVNFFNFGFVIFIVLATYSFITKETRQFLFNTYYQLFRKR